MDGFWACVRDAVVLFLRVVVESLYDAHMGRMEALQELENMDADDDVHLPINLLAS